MKFRLSSLLSFILIVCLSLTLLLTIRENSELTRQRDAILNLPITESDQIGVTRLGGTLSDSNVFIGTHIIRIQNHQNYQLQLNYYDSETQGTRVELAGLNFPILSLQYLPHDDLKFASFRLEHASNSGIVPEHVFRVPPFAGEMVFLPNQYDGAASIGGQPFLTFLFGNNIINRTDLWGSRADSPREIESICDTSNLDAAYFTIVKRN